MSSSVDITSVGYVDCTRLQHGHISNGVADSITQTALRSQRYKELCSLLAVSLPEVDVQCKSFLSSLTPDGDAPLAHPAERLEALSKFSTSLDNHKQDVAELLACGKYLMEMLDILECNDTPKAHEICHKLDSAARQLDHVINAIETKQSELSVEVTRFTETEADLKNIVNWLETAGVQQTQSSSHVCLNKTDLSRQVEIVKCQNDEAIKWQEHIDQVIAKCRQLRMDPANYAGLSAQCDAVVTSAAQRTEHMEALLRKLVDIQQNMDSVKQWMSDAAESLTSESTLVDHSVGQQTFVENFSNQWRLKRQELEGLLESTQTLDSAELCLDQSPLHQLLADVESQWCQVSKSFVDCVSAQVHFCFPHNHWRIQVWADLVAATIDQN